MIDGPSRRLLAGILLSVAAAAAVAASPLALDFDLAQAGWRLFTLDGVPPTRFALDQDGAITVEANRSFGLLYVPIPPRDRGKRHLTWRWRVDRLTAARPARSAEHDDRPIALHIWFEDRFDSPGALLRGLGREVASLLGYPIPGEALTYSWGGVGKRGDLIPNPVLGKHGAIRILRDDKASLGMWVEESVDLAADFRAAFNAAAPMATYLAISADMDDTLGTSAAAVTAIEFHDSAP